MAIRQYIGARYVPRFMGTYNASQLYEVLDVVDNGLGTSYILKKPAPVGTPVTNTNYWAIYGATSGAIINLQNQIDAINESLFDCQTFKKLVIITDSYGNRTNGGGLTVGDILTNDGWDIKHYAAYAGGGFVQPSANWLPQKAVDYTGDHTEITDVVFCCGANDNVGTVAAIQSDVESGLSIVRASYPLAKIHIIPWGVSFVNLLWAQVLKENTVEAYNRAVNNFANCVVAKNAQYMLRNSELLDADKIHPNASGVDYIADAVNGYLSGNEIDVHHIIYSSLTPTANVSNFVGGTITMERHNENVLITQQNAGGLLGTFDFTPAAISVSINPAFTIDKTLFSIPATTSNKYISFNSKCRATNSGDYPYGYVASTTKFIVYDGYQVRLFIAPMFAYSVNRTEGMSNTVYIID